MRLQRVLIKEFRQFSDSLDLNELQPGLNVVTGPNEAGKSTIAEAIRTVFMERYRTSALRDVIPWDKPHGQPYIEVEFHTAGTPHMLRKQFGNRPRCELFINGGQRFEGDEAEEKLAALLGFSRAAKGGMRAELAGVPGLLWVQQGQSQEIEQSAGHAVGYLRDALSQLSGSTVIGGEDALIASVEHELGKLLTGKTRKPTGELAAAEKGLEATRLDCDQLRQQVQQFQADAERLADLQAEVAKGEREKLWERFERQAQESTEKLQGLKTAKEKLEQKRKDLAELKAKIGLLREQEQAAQEAQAALDNLREEQEKERVAVEDATGEHTRASQAKETAEQAFKATQEALELANAAANAAELRKQLALHEAEIDRLNGALARATETSTAVQDLSKSAAAVELDESKLKRLRAVEGELLPLRAKKEAALTRISYRLEPGQSVLLAGESLTGAGAVTLDTEKSIVVPGVGEFTVTPGAVDLSDISTQLSRLETERTQLLQTIGVDSLPAAETRYAEWQGYQRELKSQQELLKAYAPTGLDALSRQFEEEKARREAVDKSLAALPDTDTALPQPEAKRGYELADAELKAANQKLTSAAERQSTANAKVHSLESQIASRQAQLDSPAMQSKRQERQTQLVDALAKQDVLQEEIEDAALNLERQSTDVNEKDVERYQKSADNARTAQANLEKKVIELRARLEEAGASGLGERLAQAEALVEQLERRHSELALRAGGLGLLTDVLNEERDATMQQLQAPVLERLGHYVRRVLPQAQLAITDDLSPSQLQRGNQLAEFGSLSFGTREQLGILSRLAYADLLKDAGRPTLLVFDDAAVNTDPRRLEGIKRALLDAAARHQILVFTCHPEFWSDLGVPARKLDDLRMAAH
ncbi:AAA family ATPase [Burkholderia pseudomallei]|uniref:AAA family ATPase n=1 Tax=Burkholderia pseudomallei TaxID=28450 RepID=UPI000537CBC6|nr:AAA family ATPase [Burkholderia pseudomallei]KGX39649.1 AAA domain protein [Burkholderia pseudomallei MSHR2138]